eukprot:395913-Hanusia_phi.AAC.1
MSGRLGPDQPHRGCEAQHRRGPHPAPQCSCRAKTPPQFESSRVRCSGVDALLFCPPVATSLSERET